MTGETNERDDKNQCDAKKFSNTLRSLESQPRRRRVDATLDSLRKFWLLHRRQTGAAVSRICDAMSC